MEPIKNELEMPPMKFTKKKNYPINEDDPPETDQLENYKISLEIDGEEHEFEGFQDLFKHR